ncbi:MAG: hypothetical protein HYU68_03010 [Bacteroidetes bacterium]|nr:hypothetical protein [Bacteroidota bacterium]
MINDFIHELETLTNQQLSTETTEIGSLIRLNSIVVIHFIELNKLTQNLDLPAWKAKNKLENTISIFENEWRDKKAGVLSRIKSKLGLNNKIYARKTTVKKLNRSEAFDFLAQNHINDALKTKYNFGLIYNNELVAIACFGPIMHKKTEGKGELSGELIRFCNKLDYTVVGGLSKLLKYFITQYQVDDVMTYIDKDWSDGKSFIQLGFEVVGEKHQFPHYVDLNQKQFTQESNETVTIYKSGLMKLLLKVGK